MELVSADLQQSPLPDPLKPEVRLGLITLLPLTAFPPPFSLLFLMPPPTWPGPAGVWCGGGPCGGAAAACNSPGATMVECWLVTAAAAAVGGA